MKKISMICLAAGLACAATAVAKPPLQLVEKGVFVQPQRIASAKLVNGKIQIGEWQDYNSGVSTRGAKGVFYSFDCFESYTLSANEYPNHANGGQGAVQFDTRWPGHGAPCTDDIPDGSRWFFGSGYTNAVMVDDVTSNDCFDMGGNAVDSLDFGWYWGGNSTTTSTECYMAFFTSDDDGTCAVTDPLANTYYPGVVLYFGVLPGNPGFYNFTNVEGLYSSSGIFVQQPAPGGSYAMFMGQAYDDETGVLTLQTLPGTQMMLWGTGDSTSATPFRAGTQSTDGWDDDNPISGLFETGECYTNNFGICPDPLGKALAMGSYRCPADVNNDGFVNGDDYDAFASAFDVADLCADYNGDGFVNGDDYDAFASNFDTGC